MERLEADLLIVGGGINGVGIARDAAGRGLSVVLAEQGDLGAATSSASSKLIHGGLRYLEQLEFRLVAEALGEREVLLRAAPHLVSPMRFVMPHAAGLRPRWVIRSGLFLYDWLARRDTLPASAAVHFARSTLGDGLKSEYSRGYAYWDCRVDDARLVIANARAAAARGARILTRTRCVEARREGAHWRAELNGAAGETVVRARVLVNAAGPWVDRFLTSACGEAPGAHVKLVQGSHIVVPRLYAGDHAFILQNDDRRVVFVYSYERDYTLIGTTDVEHRGDPGACSVTGVEVDYLCRAANRYFTRQITPADVKWSYCGLRALVDDGAANPSQVTRDYRLDVAGGNGTALLVSVFGGKITTYRRLAERALEKVSGSFPGIPGPWTAGAALPGGDLPEHDPQSWARALAERYRGLPEPLVHAVARRHGACAQGVLGDAQTPADLGMLFGDELCAREVDFFMDHEWARSAEDILWRRTKTGLHMTHDEQDRLAAYVEARVRESAMR